MRKKYMITVCFLTIMMPVSAYSAISIRQSTAYQIEEIKAELNARDFEQYAIKASSSDARISDLEGRILQAEEHKNLAEEDNDPLGILYADSVIENCTDELLKEKTALAEYTLQAEQNYYYVENQKEIVEKAKSEIEYAELKDCLNAQLQDNKIEYLIIYRDELKERKKIGNSKIEKGYSTKAEIADLEAQLESVEAELETAREEQDFLKDKIFLNGNKYEEIDLPETVDYLEKEDSYIQNFLAHSVQSKYYEQQIRAYENYIDAVGSTENKENSKLHLKLLQLSREKYETDLELYVRQKIMNFNQTKRNLDVLELRINAMNEKIREKESLLERGKIIKVDVLELKAQLKELEYNKQQIHAEGVLLRYILEKQIEEVQ